ncbi:MAG: DUF3102 domain-containing protein [Planctomycetota bacterium]
MRDLVLAAEERIDARVKRTVEDIIANGEDLLAVKEELEHGQFGNWLKTRFGWSERSAQGFMTVAQWARSANFADLAIAPSAAYLLAAPSSPDGARKEALTRAEEGEEITHAIAKELLRSHRETEPPTLEKRWSSARNAILAIVTHHSKQAALEFLHDVTLTVEDYKDEP